MSDSNERLARVHDLISKECHEVADGMLSSTFTLRMTKDEQKKYEEVLCTGVNEATIPIGNDGEEDVTIRFSKPSYACLIHSAVFHRFDSTKFKVCVASFPGNYMEIGKEGHSFPLPRIFGQHIPVVHTSSCENHDYMDEYSMFFTYSRNRMAEMVRPMVVAALAKVLSQT